MAPSCSLSLKVQVVVLPMSTVIPLSVLPLSVPLPLSQVAEVRFQLAGTVSATLKSLVANTVSLSEPPFLRLNVLSTLSCELVLWNENEVPVGSGDGSVTFFTTSVPQFAIVWCSTETSSVLDTKLDPEERDSHTVCGNDSHEFAGMIPAAVRSTPNSANCPTTRAAP